MPGEDDFRLAYSPNEACAAIGCGRSKLYEIIREGHLDVRRMHAHHGQVVARLRRKPPAPEHKRYL